MKTRKYIFRLGTFLGTLLIICLSGLTALTQNNTKLAGNFNAGISIYDFKSTDSLMKGRNKPFGWNLNGNFDLRFSDKFSLPFSFSIVNTQVNAYYPIPNLKIKDRLIHPSSVISFSPTFKWGSFYIGSHVPQVSKLIAGEVQIFGVGFDINPGIFRLASSYGYSEIAIRPDSLLSIRGSYRRHYTSAKVGVGKIDKSGFYLNLVKFSDASSSITLPSEIEAPQEGIGVSSNIDLKLSEKLKFIIDAGGSVYTEDQFSSLADTNDLSRALGFLIKPRMSSFTDLAGMSSITYNNSKFDAGLNAQYFGAGFKTPGFPYRPSDVLDLTANTRLSLFSNKFNYNGIIGLRKDNISKTKITSNNSLLINVSFNAVLTKNISLNSSYSNFGIERKELNDSLNLSTVSSNLVIAPSFNFKSGNLNHLLNMGVNFNQSENLNLFTGVRNNNIIKTYNVMHNINSGDYNVSLAAFLSQNNQNGIDITTHSLSIFPSIVFLNKKVRVGLNLNFSKTLIGTTRKDIRSTYALRSSYDFQNGIKMNINGNLTSFDSHRPLINTGFNESMVQIGLSYTIKNSNKKKSIKGDKPKIKNKEVEQPKQIIGVNRIDDVPANSNVIKTTKDSIHLNSINKKDEKGLLIANDNVKKEVSIEQTRSNNTSKSKPVNSEIKPQSIENTERKKSDTNSTIENKPVIEQKINIHIIKDTIVGRPTVTFKEQRTSIPLVPEDNINKGNAEAILANDSQAQKSDGLMSNSTNPQTKLEENLDSLKKATVMYYIQIEASKWQMDVTKTYKHMPDTVIIKNEQGMYKYLIPCGSKIEAALECKKKYKAKGYKDAFIVKYINDIKVK